MKRAKPQLLEVSSDSEDEPDFKKVVQDTSSSEEEEEKFDGFEGGEDEMSELVDFNADQERQ